MKITNKSKTESAVTVALILVDNLEYKLQNTLTFTNYDIETLLHCLNIGIRSNSYSESIVSIFINIHNTLTVHDMSTLELDNIRQRINDKLQIQ